MQSAPGTELHESNALHAQSNMRTKHCRHRAACRQSTADTDNLIKACFITLLKPVKLYYNDSNRHSLPQGGDPITVFFNQTRFKEHIYEVKDEPGYEL